MIRPSGIVFSVLITLPFPLFSQSVDNIRLNQVGFYPDGPKFAVVKSADSVAFSVTSPDMNDTVLTRTLTAAATWTYSGESVRLAEFSEVTTPGTYVLHVPGVGTSYPFEVKRFVHENVGIAALKNYYFQRCSFVLMPQEAGVWARAAGHPDTSVLIHPSAATPQRPAGMTIKAAFGWYDAGDYNKYVVNSGITLYTLMALYEHFPDYCKRLTTHIPESANALPDILDEVLFNLRWMLAMQDPHDGGVYHKLTNPEFDGWVMPFNATNPRYVVKKSTASALNFAAVTAQAARIFSGFSIELPGFADTCLQASLGAWGWARKNPAVYYDQKQMNQQFSPDINTGEYGDGSVSDEFSWAAAELSVTTLQDSFLSAASPVTPSPASVPAWPSVRTLGLYSLGHHRGHLPSVVDTNSVKSSIIQLANALRSTMNSSAYHVAMGAQQNDFVWGSNGIAANQGMACLVAYQLTRDSTHLHTAIANLDYLLGRNATTYCFVTGHGDKPAMNPHHRPSQADNIVNPVPGLLVGGPNPRQEDTLSIYPSNLPARSYVDDYRSYASNENAINWNAPFVYLALGIEAILSPTGTPNTIGPGDLRQGRPEGFLLEQNFPNPFNGSTMMRYACEVKSRVRLSILDLLGREVAVVVNGEKEAGWHSAGFDGSALASGVYLCRLAVGSSVQTRKMVLQK